MKKYLYTVDEVAEILKVSRNTVYNLINKGELNALRLGKLKVAKPTLKKFIEHYNL